MADGEADATSSSLLRPEGTLQESLCLALPKTFIYCNGYKKVGVKEYWTCLPDTFPIGWGLYEIKQRTTR